MDHASGRANVSEGLYKIMKKNIIKVFCLLLSAFVLLGAVSCNPTRKENTGISQSSAPIDVDSSAEAADASASPFDPAQTQPSGSQAPQSDLPSETPNGFVPDTDDPTASAQTDRPSGNTDEPTQSHGAGETPTQGITGAPVVPTPALTSGATSQPTPTPKPTPTPTPKPTPTSAPMPSTHPYPTDPTEIAYAEAGKRLMRTLKSMPGYEKLDIRARRGFDYLIVINKAAYKNTVTVFCVDEEGNYTRPYLSMVCSAGNNTPLGVFNTMNRYSWHTLIGPCFGQYCTRIVGGVLFHSVPYTTCHKYDLKYTYYNKLGNLASAGCIRLPCNDAKWIYDNCPLGTTVVIYSDSSSAGPLGQPTPMRLDKDDIRRFWDPTDPDRANPWGDRYKAGYTIRSQIAQADYDYAMAHGLWDGSINKPEAPTPLPEISPTPALTDTPAPTSAPTDTPAPATPTPTPGPTPTPTPGPTPTPTPEPTPTPAPTLTPRPTATPAPPLTIAPATPPVKPTPAP